MIAGPKVVIDESTHVYTKRADGIVVPSNTGVLRAAGHGVSRFYTEDGREVGKAAHLGCRFYDEGRLEWASLDTPAGADARTAKLKAKVRGRVKSYVEFRKDTGFEPDLIEFVTFSEELGVAGTIDRTGTFPGDPANWVIDLKGGAEADWHAYQTAGYTLMEFPHNSGEVKRAALYLRDDGKRAQLRVHSNANDFAKFLEAVHEFKNAQRSLDKRILP